MRNGSVLVRIIVFVIFSFAAILILDYIDPASLQSPYRIAIGLGIGLFVAVFGVQILRVLNIFDWIGFLSKPFR